MENGSYRYSLEMQTPLGLRRGELVLSKLGESLTGQLTMFLRTTPIFEGKLSGYYVSFSGEMKTMIKDIRYKAEGSLRGNKISVVFATPTCHFPAKGFLLECGSNEQEE